MIASIIKEAGKLLKGNLTNNIQKIDNYIVFDSLFFQTRIQSKKATTREIEKDIYNRKDLGSLLLYTLAKDYTIIKAFIEKGKEEYIFENFYKEFKRTRYFIEFEDATHFLTITYKALETDDIFSKIEYNKYLSKLCSKGLQRMRVYFKKYFKSRLKYIKVIEFTKKGTIHFHMLIKIPEKFREDFKEMINKLAKWFDTAENGIDLKYLKRAERKKAVKYIAKYLNFKDNHSIKEVSEGSKIYCIEEERILYNATKRRLSYSYKEKPKIKIYKTSELIDKREAKEEKIFTKATIEREFNRNIEVLETDEKTKKKILENFEKIEWKRYETSKQIKKVEKEETRYYYKDPPNQYSDEPVDF